MCWVAVASPSFFSRAKGGNLQRPIGPSVFTVEFFKLKGSEKTRHFGKDIASFAHYRYEH